MSDPDELTVSRRDTLAVAGLMVLGTAAVGGEARADEPTPQAGGNQRLSQPALLEGSYPLAGDADRLKSVDVIQQLVVDLLALSNLYKQAHWNLNGPLYLVLHEYYDDQADYYRDQADVFAERVLHLGYSVDGRYSTIARTSTVADFPAGYDTDTGTLRLLVERVTTVQKEAYAGIKATGESDAPTSNKLQDLVYAVDKNLWQLRIHLARPGGTGDALPYTAQQGRGAAK